MPYTVTFVPGSQVWLKGETELRKRSAPRAPGREAPMGSVKQSSMILTRETLLFCWSLRYTQQRTGEDRHTEHLHHLRNGKTEFYKSAAAVRPLRLVRQGSCADLAAAHLPHLHAGSSPLSLCSVGSSVLGENEVLCKLIKKTTKPADFKTVRFTKQTKQLFQIKKT